MFLIFETFEFFTQNETVKILIEIIEFVQNGVSNVYFRTPDFCLHLAKTNYKHWFGRCAQRREIEGVRLE